jgi:Flp pilus assembly protein TadG
MKRRNGIHSNGSMLAEAAIASLLFIPMLAYTINTVVGLMAYSAVDGGCRDAARAAAEAPPDYVNNPNNPGDLAQQAATAAVQMHSFGFVNLNAEVISYNGTVIDEGAGGNPQNNFFLCNAKSGLLVGPPYQGPYVTVKTSLVYPLPFPVLTEGLKIGPIPLTFQQIYSYPILHPVIWPPS